MVAIYRPWVDEWDIGSYSGLYKLLSCKIAQAHQAGKTSTGLLLSIYPNSGYAVTREEAQDFASNCQAAGFVTKSAYSNSFGGGKCWDLTVDWSLRAS